MRITAHLDFPGNCEAAFLFYRECLGGNIGAMLTWQDSPLAGMVSETWQQKICHASLDNGSLSLAGTDVPPDRHRQTQGVQLILDAESAEQARQFFTALADNGTIILPITGTFWAECYGILKDQFGVQWEIQFSK
jgi:PhnB protein